MITSLLELDIYSSFIKKYMVKALVLHNLHNMKNT